MQADRVRFALRDILGEIDAIGSHIEGISFEQYRTNWGMKRAVERGVEIISEACRRLPPELCERAPSVPWKEIRGIGNVLRHDYDDVVDQVMFRVATERLAPLKAAVLAMDAASGGGNDDGDE